MACNKCFAERCTIDGRTACRILSIRKCMGYEKCSSYKTKEQCDEQNKKCMERLMLLPLEKRIHISEKYGLRLVAKEEEFDG